VTADRTPTLTVPIPSTENAEAKARRYLLEGRLRVRMVKGGRSFAECRGNGHIWHPCYVGDRWRCNCPARGRCAHLVALQLVTSAPNQEARP
jgi:hypothetical protein